MSQSNLARLANYLCCLDFRSPLGSANDFKDLASEYPFAVQHVSNKRQRTEVHNRAATARTYRMLWRQSRQFGRHPDISPVLRSSATRDRLSIETVSSE
jgi:hypothetical protein